MAGAHSLKPRSVRDGTEKHLLRNRPQHLYQLGPGREQGSAVSDHQHVGANTASRQDLNEILMQFQHHFSLVYFFLGGGGGGSVHLLYNDYDFYY